jgi:hypothetical protein
VFLGVRNFFGNLFSFEVTKVATLTRIKYDSRNQGDFKGSHVYGQDFGLKLKNCTLKLKMINNSIKETSF